MDVVQLTKTFTRAAEVTMITSAQSDETFDYQATAELFTGKNIRVRSRVLKYVRFNHAADAIRFAIEQLPADVLLGAYLEVDERRYDSRGIRRLYDWAEYPFTRLAKVA
ncbi:MAG: hypothetical protein WAR76_20125 [Xanthobacteraceae bacterium]|jgi:hypothetical protein